MIKLSELSSVLGVIPVRSELSTCWSGLIREYLEQKPNETWESFYAKELVTVFATATPSRP